MRRCETLCDACGDRVTGYDTHTVTLVIATGAWRDTLEVDVHHCDDCVPDHDATWRDVRIYADSHGRILATGDGWDLRNIHHDETFRNIITGAANRVKDELDYVRSARDWTPQVIGDGGDA